MPTNRVRFNGVEIGWTDENFPRPYIAAGNPEKAVGVLALLFPDTLQFETVSDIPGRPSLTPVAVKLLATSWRTENNQALKWALDELAAFVMSAPGACQLEISFDYPQKDFVTAMAAGRR